jgi:hypothetical protein
MSATIQAPGLGEERPAPDEDALIAQVVDLSLALLDKTSKPVHRGQHPKQHACLEADFVVEPDLPEELRYGVFREARTFTALVRFSNGKAWDDRKGDIHGMAVKLLEVDGEKVLESEKHERTQDFLMADASIFFVRNITDYVPFSKVIFNAARHWWGKLVVLFKILFSANPTWKILKKNLSSKPDSPLRARYWSQTPYKLGPSAIKFSARPDLSLVPVPPESDSKDKYRESMAAHLASGQARFDFLVQVQADPATMPVEDPTIPWDEAVSPFRKVATILIPPQDFDNPARMTFGENLSYTPWHALEDQRPLGSINRTRKVVYEILSKERHKLNGAPRKEPTVEEIPGGRASRT